VTTPVTAILGPGPGLKTFALDAVERAGKSFLQGAAGGAALVLSSVDAGHLTSAAWWQQLLVSAGVGGFMAVSSVLTSVASAAKTGTASLSRTVALAPPSPAALKPTVVASLLAPPAAPVSTPVESSDTLLPDPLGMSGGSTPVTAVAGGGGSGGTTPTATP
jgi:hypothetical protein